MGPMGPVAPAAPVGPMGPIGPVAPVAPVGPIGPMGPVAPVAPVGPIRTDWARGAGQALDALRTLRTGRSLRNHCYVQMRDVAGLVVLLGIEHDIARRRTERDAIVAGGRGHPALQQRGDVDHDELFSHGGRKRSDGRTQRGYRCISHGGLAPRAGDRQHTDQAGGVDPVDEEFHRSLADLAGHRAAGQRGEVELNQRRAAIAHIEVR
jgi:hypothetical protein